MTRAPRCWWQPCAALRGKRCGIYAQRPECCRTFECRLLRNVQGGVMSLEAARAVVEETQTKIAQLRRLAAELERGQGQGQGNAGVSFRESCAEALEASGEGRSTRKLDGQREELEQGLAVVELLIQRQFLGAGKKRLPDVIQQADIQKLGPAL